MDTLESHKYRQAYIKSFLPLTAFFSIICLIGVSWDYISFVESRKHLNERAIKGLQELLQTRINNIKEWEQIEALNLVPKEALEPFRKQKM